MGNSNRIGLLAAALLAGTAISSGAALAAPEAEVAGTGNATLIAQEHSFDITAQPLASALKQFASQAGLQIMFAPNLVEGHTAPAIQGRQTGTQALRRLLTGTGLDFAVEGVTVAVRPATSKTADNDVTPSHFHLAQTDTTSSSEEGLKTGREEHEHAQVSEKGVPEILVKGARTLNTDIRRGEDDVQPYVVFDSEDLKTSQAINLEEFFKTRLSMNTANATLSQIGTGIADNRSTINLRGLGANQTLILVDGRRVPGVTLNGEVNQPDINGIPMASVERIEVLPSTAGGIYGGSATGGVVNIILKRDYRGLDVNLSYGNVFKGSADIQRADLSGGFSLEGGRTQITMFASHMESGSLLRGERDFKRRSRELQLANNPSAILNGFLPLHGSTANIKSATGDNLVLDNNTALNSTITHLPAGYQGYANDGGAGLLANAGAYNVELADDIVGLRSALISNPKTQSASANIRREFGSRIDAFANVSLSTNQGNSTSGLGSSSYMAANAPGNPFQQDIYVDYPVAGLTVGNISRSQTRNLSGGVIFRLGGDWTGEIDYSRGDSRFKYIRTQPIIDAAGRAGIDSGADPGDGRPVLNILRDTAVYPLDLEPYRLPSPNDFGGPYDTVLKDASLRLSGPVFELPAGKVVLSGLAETRKELMKDTVEQSMDFADQVTYRFVPHGSQQIDSYYLEARVPLVSGRNALPFARELELQASMRRDEYRTEGAPYTDSVGVPSPDGPFPQPTYFSNSFASDDYTLGLRFQPLQDLTVRASVGTGFLPASISQVAPGNFPWIYGGFAIDPLRGGPDGPLVGGEGDVLLLVSGNPNLKPETSRSVSAGVIFTPHWIAELRISLDYTRTSKEDEIRSTDTQFILDNEAAYPGRVVREPLTQQDIDNGFTGGRITIIDVGAINVATTELEAYDFKVDYTLQAGSIGTFSFNTIATWQPHLQSRFFDGGPLVESAGHYFGPLKWRGNAGVRWDRGPLAVAWNMQYYAHQNISRGGASSFTETLDRLNQGGSTIPRQIYHDVIAQYRPQGINSSLGRMLNDTEFSLGIQNVFNTSPPILAESYDSSRGYSTFGDARLRRYTFAVSKHF